MTPTYPWGAVCALHDECSWKHHRLDCLLICSYCRLAHCSAGAYGKEYAWQQDQNPLCDNVLTDPALSGVCYCHNSSWQNVSVYPSLGQFFVNTAVPPVRITRMFTGTIPSTWGRLADGSLAPWAATLTSV